MMNNPLRFCMITTFYPPYNFGGDGIFVHLLANELARRGHHVEVIHCADAYRLLAHQEPAEMYEDHPHVTVHQLHSPFGFLSPLATQQTGFPFFKSARLRQILDTGFDVIHYHNISLVGGPKILEYGRGIKLYTIHEYWLVCPTHTLFKFNREPCERRHCLTCSVIHKRPPQWWRYFGLMASATKHVDAFISPSRFGKNLHYDMGLDRPIVHMPHFVASNETTLSTAVPPMRQEFEEPYFLFVGRLEHLKGVQTLIPVFRHYQKARLLIAGQGSLEPQLRQLSDGSPNIQFLGHQSGQQLRALYQRAVALIVPSLCYELFSLVTVEALREGTPVIVRNIGAMPEIVQASAGGFVYNTDEELAAAMDRLLADLSFRDELGNRGHQAYQRNWTPDVYMDRYLALIGELGATRGQPRAEALVFDECQRELISNLESEI